MKFKKKKLATAPIVSRCPTCSQPFTSAYAAKRHRAMLSCEVTASQRINHEPLERD